MARKPPSTTPTTDLQREVIALTRRLIQHAESGFHLAVPTPEIRFDLRGKAAGMVIFSNTGTVVRYNPKLLEENGASFVDQTVPHEVAHLIARALHGRRIRPHGPEWKLIMAFFGVPSHRCHNFSTASTRDRRMRYFAYRCGCRDHRLSAIRHNRCRSGVTYLCRSCGTPLVATTTP